MILSFFESKAKIWQYIFLWVAFALIESYTISTITNTLYIVLLIDSIFYAALYAVFGVLLWSVIKYGNFGSLSLIQRVVNYSALGLLTILATLGLGYAFGFVFELNVQEKLNGMLVLRGFITFLVYLLLVQHFKFSSEHTTNEPEQVPLENEIEKSDNELEQPTDHEIIERVAVKSGQKIHVILVSEILYLQADGDYVQINSMSGKYLKEQTMKYFSEHLPSGQFVRVHRSCIVNIEAISRIELYEKQTRLLTLKNGFKIKVSQTGYAALREKLSL
jgi:hypothetical protein